MTRKIEMMHLVSFAPLFLLRENLDVVTMSVFVSVWVAKWQCYPVIMLKMFTACQSIGHRKLNETIREKWFNYGTNTAKTRRCCTHFASEEIRGSKNSFCASNLSFLFESVSFRCHRFWICLITLITSPKHTQRHCDSIYFCYLNWRRFFLLFFSDRDTNKVGEFSLALNYTINSPPSIKPSTNLRELNIDRTFYWEQRVFNWLFAVKNRWFHWQMNFFCFESLNDFEKVESTPIVYKLG